MHCSSTCDNVDTLTLCKDLIRHTVCRKVRHSTCDAVCDCTLDRILVPEYHILKLAKDAIVLKDFNGNQVEPDYLEVDWELNNAGKNGYPFYMEKEIMEQPDAIERTITNRITSGMPDFTADVVPDEILYNSSEACQH